MLAKIGFKSLEISGLIGVYESEKKYPQPLIIDLEIGYDIHSVAKSDNLEDTINYEKLVHSCIETIQEKHFHTLEALASKVLSHLMDLYNLRQAIIRIVKPNALASTKGAFVELQMVKD